MAETLKPQAGPQENFLATPADIAVYGGAAGGGKSWAILAEPLRHIDNPHFGAVVFRRNSVQVRNEGGLWDESQKIYPLVGAELQESILQWKFPAGSKLKFAHLEHEKTKLDWQGAQIPFIGWDELTHFTRSQFLHLLTEEANHALQQDYSGIARKLAEGRRVRPAKCVAPTPHPIDAAAGGGEHAGPDGVSADALRDFAAECEAYRAERMTLERFIMEAWQTKG